MLTSAHVAVLKMTVCTQGALVMHVEGILESALEKADVTVTPAWLVPSNFKDTGANRVTWSMT